MQILAHVAGEPHIHSPETTIIIIGLFLVWVFFDYRKQGKKG